MQKILFSLIFSFSLLLATNSSANSLDFSTYTLGEGSPHILIIGGIQGDEPGGFSAASLLSTHYTITKGTVHIVPNLNFDSILQRSRGLNGDMNRKFAEISTKDPDYDQVKRIQKIITSPCVDLVLNLHDGSGYYYPEHLSTMQNPKRWGQCVIIDQANFDVPTFGNLDELAQEVVGKVNENLLDEKHKYHVNNTHTATHNIAMSKSLTWFALSRGKPAFAIETSKDLSVEDRTFYHLNTIEAFFDTTGVEFERSFSLNATEIKQALSNEIYIGLAQNAVVIPLHNARPVQAGSFPLPVWAEESVQASSPILAIQNSGGTMHIRYGNNHITSFTPSWHNMDYGLNTLEVIVDNQVQNVHFGDIVHVKDSFYVSPITDYRVNAIGAVMGENESGIYIKQEDFMPHFSIDMAASSFRVEVYKGAKYAGTFVVCFGDSSLTTVSTPLPAVKFNESAFGR